MPIPLALVAPALRVGACAVAAYEIYDKMKDLQASTERYLEAHKPTELSGTYGHNDAQDAFRHAFASAKMALQGGEALANFAGTLYELKGEARGQSKSEQGMDLWNNRVGREIARDLPRDATDKQIGDAVMAALRNDRLVVNLADGRAQEGLRTAMTLNDLSNGMTNLLNNAKSIFRETSTEDVAAARDAAGKLSAELMSALVKGAERADGFNNASLEAKFVLAMANTPHAPTREVSIEPAHGQPQAHSTGSLGDGLAGVRIPGVEFASSRAPREMDR